MRVRTHNLSLYAAEVGAGVIVEMFKHVAPEKAVRHRVTSTKTVRNDGGGRHRAVEQFVIYWESGDGSLVGTDSVVVTYI